MAARDIKSNFSDFELQVNDVTGDWAIADSDQVHIKDLGVSWLGHWREYPFVGVGVFRFNNAPISLQTLKRDYRLQLQTDGYRVITVEVTNTEQIRVNAERVEEQQNVI